MDLTLETFPKKYLCFASSQAPIPGQSSLCQMDGASLMSGVAGVWSGLERLQATDPTEYKRVVRESLAWGEAKQSLPQPALCVKLATKSGVQVQTAAVVVVVSVVVLVVRSRRGLCWSRRSGLWWS